MPFKVELKALRIGAEVVGVITMLVTGVRWIASGSLLDAIEPLLPVLGGIALAVWLIGGIAGVVFGKGAERLGGAAWALAPILYLVLDLSVARLGLLAFGICVLGLLGMFVDLVGGRAHG
ncbi:hypothetical protein ACFPJ1_12085 [Kribbella qitaiheensis]|uniref:hypothetical protein n=1 Tax=Kribbella qitaiheensis TaxID=1544730 RepID=UPI0036070FE9